MKIELTSESIPKHSAGVKAARTHRKNRTGIFGISKEKRAKTSRKTGLKIGRENVERKRGIWSEEFLKENPLGELRSTEDRRKSGRKLKQEGRGFNASELYGYGSHVRHHVHKLVFNPKCHFCVNPVPLSETKAARKSRQYRKTGSTLV